MMIQNLTTEQQSRFEEFVTKWTEIGLSTQPANRGEAEAGVKMAYGVAGLEAPRIVWCASPLSQGLTHSTVFALQESKVKVGRGVWNRVWESVRARVRDSVRARVGDSVWDSVSVSVLDSIGARVGDSVGGVVASVRARVVASVRASGANVWASVCQSGYGQHDASWLGFYDYFKTVCGLDSETQKLCGIWKISQNAGWWLPYEKLCWISERHNVLNRDNGGRLHCEDGPAVAYPDGWSIYAVHGVRVPDYVIERPSEITVVDIEKTANVEVRRVKIDRYGQLKYLLDSGAKEIHSDDFGTLYRKEMSGGEPLVMVKVVNSTPEPDGSFKDYFIRVNPELRPLHADGTMGDPQEMTARNAVASTFGKKGQDYAPIIQT